MPLAPLLRGRLERQTGANLGAVRLHTDAHADRLATSHRANAVTIGRDIFFASGRFRPETAVGFGLLVHELTHVRQLAAGAVPAGPLTMGHRRHLEHEAHTHERAALLGLPLPALRTASGGDLATGPSPARSGETSALLPLSSPERGEQAIRLPALRAAQRGWRGHGDMGAPWWDEEVSRGEAPHQPFARLPLAYASQPANQPPALRQEVGTAAMPSAAMPSPAEPASSAPGASAAVDSDALAEQVYSRIERRMRLERERGGTGRWR